MPNKAIYIPGAFVAAFLARLGWEAGGWLWMKILA